MGNYYELRYTYDGKEVVHKMPADIDAGEMYYFIKDFLLGCSWHPDIVDKIIGKDE